MNVFSPRNCKRHVASQNLNELVLSPQDEQSDDDSGDYIEPEADETLDQPQGEFLIHLKLFVYLPTTTIEFYGAVYTIFLYLIS